MRYDISNNTPPAIERFRKAKSLCRHADRSQQSQKTTVYTPQTVTVPRVKVTDAKMLTTTDLFAAKKQPAISGQKKVQGDAQVTVVCCNLQHTTEAAIHNVSQPLAGASPHAPDPPLRKRKRPDTKDGSLNLRVPSEMKRMLLAKCAVLETYPSAYVLELIAADLCLPTDDYRATRNKHLKKAFADLRIAFDDCGTNINQMAKATNSGKPWNSLEDCFEVGGDTLVDRYIGMADAAIHACRSYWAACLEQKVLS